MAIFREMKLEGLQYFNMWDNCIPHLQITLISSFTLMLFTPSKTWEVTNINTKFSKTYLFLWIWTGSGVIKEQSEARSPVKRDIGCFSDQYSKRRGWWNKTWKKCKSTIKKTVVECLSFIPTLKKLMRGLLFKLPTQLWVRVMFVTQQGFYLSIPWNHPHQLNIAPGRHHRVRLILLLSPLPLWYLQFVCKPFDDGPVDGRYLRRLIHKSFLP